MSTYTYEYEAREGSLETYEWDNVWWEHTEIKDARRVMYIGDSISCATRKSANTISDGELLFDGFGTSKALDNRYFKDSLRIFAAQQGKRDIILFNNGLHGWHLSEDEYADYYDDFVKFLIGEFNDTPILILLTTHISDDERDKRVCVRNEKAMAVAEKYGIPTVDLYTLTYKNSHFLSADGVHLVREGYDILANAVIDEIRKVLDTEK